MSLFIFVGFFIGYVLSLRFIKRPKIALAWGILLGVIPLALILGHANTPIQGIGSILYFAIFALGPLVIIPVFASSLMLGVAGSAATLLVSEERASWIRLSISVTLVCLIAAFTLIPVAQREITKQNIEKDRIARSKDRIARSEAIMRTDFKGTISGYSVSFPASPSLSLFDQCDQEGDAKYRGCWTSLSNPVTILTGPDTELLNERNKPIRFNVISFNALKPNCGSSDYCLTQDKIDNWCSEIRPDQAQSIWCNKLLSLSFSLRTDEFVQKTTSPSNRNEPELSSNYAETLLGSGKVTCFYHRDSTKTEHQGVSCTLSFNLVDKIKAVMLVQRTQITSSDPAVAETIALIPKYWQTLTGGRS
jgi:hypothetical protein